MGSDPWSKNHVSACARAIGVYGEEKLAIPVLSEVFKFSDLTDLNRKCKKNYPWADFHGWRDGAWWMINVKTRSKWQKPNSVGMRYRNTLYIGSTEQRLDKAKKLLSKSGLADARRIGWLALSLDTDQTFDACWGDIEEMRQTRLKTHLTPSHAVDLSDDMIGRYIRSGRFQPRLRHDFPWLNYPESWWTYEAHKAWLKGNGE
ncbi:MAG TPA: hypothetical protein VG456_25010 [Candidatus Sulfopaludibacter sp.]|jgi:hypothetical protein|nr:hypothetical protein [Candidatus Sulfopaludibacter sp.]